MVTRCDSTLLLANPYTGVYATAHQGDMAYGDGGLKPNEVALIKAWYEADAWCRWAGRRLPSEVEWEAAAHQGASRGWRWGDVWEWTATTFRPYPGFAPGPLRDYSQAAFGTHKVLRGASFATRSRMKHPKYRNFFLPERDDIFVGFRSCAL